MKYEFTEEELSEKIKVPSTVETRLRDIVEKCLSRCGLYHQVFSRIKSHHSLARKYKRKSYNEEKKIQDLIGIRIDVYFEDDLKICRSILEKLFGEADWSLTEYSEEEFKPTKINGVFKLPEELKKMISEETWDFFIDDTFEIQLKTVFFEGWHEIEHDMKYKGTDLWHGKGDRSRYFNTILATLELCDKSIVTLFENLGHDLYHEKNWAGMMKAHFRIKMRNEDIYPELIELFDNDTRVDNVPKRIFKTKREDLIYALLQRPDNCAVTPNTIIAVLNDTKIHDEQVGEVLEREDVYGKRSEKSFVDEVKYDLKLPEFLNTFRADVKIKNTEENKDKHFSNAVKTIYSWFYNKYSEVLIGLSEECVECEIEEFGFRLKIHYEPENYVLMARAEHVDQRYAGRIWITEAAILPGEDDQFELKVLNGFTYYQNANSGEVPQLFSCPRFYRQIATQIGVRDVWDMGNIYCVMNDKQVQQLVNLLLDEDRKFPVVLVVSANEKDGRLDESWLESFAIKYISEKAGHYAHFARIHAPMAEMMRNKLLEAGCTHDQIYSIQALEQGVFVADKKINNHMRSEWFDEEYIKRSRFATFDAIEHLQPFKEQNNGRAFGSELLQLLRRYNTDN